MPVCKISPLLIICSISCCLQAQMYNTTAGVRFGSDAGISLSQRIFRKTTAELAFYPGFFTDRVGGHLLLRRHYPILTKRCTFYLGAGLAAKENEENFSGELASSFLPGGAFQAGVEVTLGRVHLSLDFTPLVFHNQQQATFDWTAEKAVSIRYVLWKHPSRLKSFLRKKRS